MVKVFTNGLGDWGSIPGQVIPKTQKKKKKKKKRYLMLHCLTFSIIRYESRVSGVNPKKEVVASTRPWCSSY